VKSTSTRLPSLAHVIASLPIAISLPLRLMARLVPLDGSTIKPAQVNAHQIEETKNTYLDLTLLLHAPLESICQLVVVLVYNVLPAAIALKSPRPKPQNVLQVSWSIPAPQDAGMPL
jgi:hypothetical protein